MFRSHCNSNAPKEIEMMVFRPHFNLTNIIVDFSGLGSILTTELKLDPSSITGEFKRTPKRTYVHATTKNETESLISCILDDIWINIFSYLDIRTLTFMMISCKKMAVLANDDEVRERLYISKQNCFFKSFLPKSTSLKFLNEMPELPRMQQQHAAIIQMQPQEVYNDNPPGRGFVMR